MISCALLKALITGAKAGSESPFSILKILLICSLFTRMLIPLGAIYICLSSFKHLNKWSEKCWSVVCSP